MSEQHLLEAAGGIVGTALCVRSSPAGCLLTPSDWAQHRAEPFWTFARQYLPVSPTTVVAALALIHLHGQWTARRPQARSTRGSAAAWLVETLVENGNLTYADVRQKAIAAGIPWESVRKSSQRLGIVKHKTGFRGQWVWSLPGDLSGQVGG